jgi:hypothetical protein
MTDEKFRNEVDAQARKQGMGTPLGGATDILGWLGDFLSGKAILGKGYATGGVIPPGGYGFVGEVGMERAWSIPGGGTYIEPLTSSSPSAGASAPHVLHVYLDRHEIAVALDEELAYRPGR